VWASGASDYSINFIWVGESKFALKSVLGALLGGKILSVKNSVNRPGLDGNTLGYELWERSSFNSAGAFVGARVDGKLDRMYFLA
jgi:hypothetical protein